VQAMDSACSNYFLILCHAVKLCQEGSRRVIPLALDMEEQWRVLMLNVSMLNVLWWLHQNSELPDQFGDKVKWPELFPCQIRAQRSDMTATTNVSHPLNPMVFILLV
jgi:hypothetical protein